MEFVLSTQEHGDVRVDGDAIRRMSSPGRDEVTKVTLSNGYVLTVPEYPGDILRNAHLWDSDSFFYLTTIGDELGAEYIHGNWIAMMGECPRS